MLQSGLGLGSLATEVSLPIFVHHTWMWDRPCPFHHHHCLSVPHLLSSPLYPIFASLPVLPIWMTVASLNLWLLDFHTVWFSDSSGWLLRFSCNSFCGCMRRWNMSTYASILTRSPRIDCFFRGNSSYLFNEPLQKLVASNNGLLFLSQFCGWTELIWTVTALAYPIQLDSAGGWHWNHMMV